MSRAWILDVLDRELPNMVGADRDRLTARILEALPVEHIAAAVTTTALAGLLVHELVSDDQARKRLEIAKDIGNNAAMAVAERLSEIDEPAEGAAVQ